MVQDLTFQTAISKHTNDGLELRGKSLTQLANEVDFTSVLFLSITGKMPSPAQKKVLDAILILSIDHGVQPASGFVPRVVAASGNDIVTAMASTLLAIGPYHGGAISKNMEILLELNQAPDIEQAAIDLVKKYRSEKKRISGFGHPKYTKEDPRTTQLFSLARQHKLDDNFVTTARTLEHAIEQELGRHLVLNVDGAIAVMLLTMGFDPKSGNAIFALARTAGSIAHILEEQSSGKWVRRLNSDQVEFTG